MLLALASTVLLVSTRPALAAQYDGFVAVEDEEDLVELYIDDVISEPDFRSLTRMLRRGVDVNLASREELYALPNLTYGEVDSILAYREKKGTIDELSELLSAGVLSAEKLRAIAPFTRIRARPKKDGEGALVDGIARLRSVWAVDTPDAPAAALEVRLDSRVNISVAVATLFTRQRLDEVSYDPMRGALTASPPPSRIQVPKYYVYWENDRFEIVAGTYRIGFGQRLTFDSTDRYTPNGIEPDSSVNSPGTELAIACKRSSGELDDSPCADDEAIHYTVPDFGWSEAQRGVAAGAKRVEFGEAWLQTYIFASHQERSIYQYEIYDRSQCLDPRLNDDACSAPRLYERKDKSASLAPALSYYTLPKLYTETLGGGNVSLFADRRTHVGITGYVSFISWNVDELELDFQEWSRAPGGGPFGAVGVDAAWGDGVADLFAEATRSFDDAGGGFAGLVRSVVALGTLGQHELEGSVRYYDSGFANPYAGPIAAADEFEGNRARDEAGARVRYVGEVLPKLQLRARADAWNELSEGRPKFDFGLRGDYELSRALLWSLGADYQTPLSLATCVESQFGAPGSEDGTCPGQRLRATGGVRVEPLRAVSLSAKYRHSFFDLYQSSGELRQDTALSLAASAWITRAFGLRARYRFDFEDIADVAHLEQSHWATLVVTLRQAGTFQVRGRYDFVEHTDERESTSRRTPNPEHWFWLTLEARL